jgi:hypothetical protein
MSEPITMEGPLANNGDLERGRYQAWAAAIKTDYYNHYFFKNIIPVAVNPPDDREDGGFTERYSTLRNANVMFAKFLTDIAAWKADILEVSNNFFKTVVSGF